MPKPGAYSYVLGDEEEKRIRELEEEARRKEERIRELELLLKQQRSPSRTTVKRSGLTDADIEVAKDYLVYSRRGGTTFAVRVVVTRIASVDAESREYVYECVSVIPKDTPRIFKSRKYSKRAFQLFPVPPGWRPDPKYLGGGSEGEDDEEDA